MAAGAGYKEFTAGEVLAATDVNQFLASQVIMVFAGTAARASAIGTPTEGMFTYLKDTDTLEYYTTTWQPFSAGGGGLEQNFLLMGA